MRGAPVRITGKPALNSNRNSTHTPPFAKVEAYVHLTNDAKETSVTHSVHPVQPLAVFSARSFQAELRVNRGGNNQEHTPNHIMSDTGPDHSLEYSNVFSGPRPRRLSRWRSASVTDAMESAFKAADTSHWEGSDPPVLATFAFRGKKGELERVAPSDAFVNKCWQRFLDYYEAGWGAPLEARWYKEFDEDQYPHFHAQFVLPAGRAHHKKGKGCRLGFLDGMEVSEWMEQAWCFASRQSPGRSKDGHGRHAWIPWADEVPQYESLVEHEKVFILYARKECNEEWRAKAVYSHRTPWIWITTGTKQVTWYGVTPALARRVKDTEATITIHCIQTLRALKDYLHDLSGAERQLVDGHNEITGEIEQYDGSYWSNERRQLRGGVLRRGLTDEELAHAMRMVNAIEELHEANLPHDCLSPDSPSGFATTSCAPECDAQFAAEPVVGKPMSPWQMTFGLKKMAPAFYELPVEEFLTARSSDDLEIPAELYAGVPTATDQGPHGFDAPVLLPGGPGRTKRLRATGLVEDR